MSTRTAVIKAMAAIQSGDYSKANLELLRGVDQRTFAAHAKCTQAYISFIENGQRTMPEFVREKYVEFGQKQLEEATDGPPIPRCTPEHLRTLRGNAHFEGLALLSGCNVNYIVEAEYGKTMLTPQLCKAYIEIGRMQPQTPQVEEALAAVEDALESFYALLKFLRGKTPLKAVKELAGCSFGRLSMIERGKAHARLSPEICRAYAMVAMQRPRTPELDEAVKVILALAEVDHARDPRTVAR